MNSDAIGMANYFVSKSVNDTSAPKLTLLRLVKYVYIAYGYGLALLNRNFLNKRFDRVEAWKYGPVIPSVYHSFKHNQDNAIKEPSSVLTSESPEGFLQFTTPKIEDKEEIVVLDFVWERYKQYSTSALINLLHQKGTPWDYCYREGENAEIPDEMTKVYYKSIVENALKN